MSCEIINTPPLKLLIQRANASIDVISNGFVGSSTATGILEQKIVRRLHKPKDSDIILTYAKSNVVFRGKLKKIQYELSVPPIVDSSLAFVDYQNNHTEPTADGFAQWTFPA
jgi:hypothetical protein